MRLSIVTTLYCSADYIAEFYLRASAVAKLLAQDNYELILVNDGSPDNSLELAITLVAQDGHVKVIDLSRNFGHHKAIMTGLSYAKGEMIFLVDSDLEEEPEWLSVFYEYMQAKPCDVVFGVQEKRKGGWSERFTGWLFYSIYDCLTGFHFPKNLVTARLLSRRYLDALLLHKEYELTLGGLYYITGFVQRPYTIRKHNSSPTTYTFVKKLNLLVNSIVSFSSRPLVGIFVLGILVLTFSMFFSAYYVLNALVLGRPPSGWTTLIVSTWVLGGLIIASIGIVGIYVSKIFMETKQRPFTIVRAIYGEIE